MQKPEAKSGDSLERDAAVIMMNGAADYLRLHYPDAVRNEELMRKLIAAMKARLAAAFEEGLRDAKEAVGAGMPDVAEQTFAASLRLAGINAAKEVLG